MIKPLVCIRHQESAPLGIIEDVVSRGVDEKSLVVPEAGHLMLRPSYEARARAYREDPQRGAHGWLLHAAEAYGAGTEASPLRAPG